MKAICLDDYSDTSIPENHVQPLVASDITALVLAEACKHITANLPNCILWEYNEANLLPGKIALDQFKGDPDTCLPLKHMFELADISEIGKTITTEQSRPNGLRNLLRRVSERTTKHIHDVWKEYKNVKIFLTENGAHIDAGIEDKFNVYNMSRRSDGFKRFITFLLMISAKQRTQQLQNTLLLIDEPDIGLHPSGARYLRDELIEIAKDNYVVYSTHSIFMIDRENIGRHLLISKTNETTSASAADHSNIRDEEVIYNALGYSIFESLESKNILFEGWRDKQLFRVALNGSTAKHRVIKKQFANVGYCHAKGVKDIGRITPILELARRDFIVVSDCDNPALEQKRRYKGAGRWLTYSDILPAINVETSEDFIKPATLVNVLSKVQETHPQLPAIEETTLSVEKGRLKVIAQWLDNGGIDQEEKERLLRHIKESLFDSIKPNQIEERYLDVLAELGKAVDEMNPQQS